MRRYDAQKINPILLGVGLPLAAASFISLFVRTGTITGYMPATAEASATGMAGGVFAKEPLLDLKVLKNDEARQAGKRATQLLSGDASVQKSPANPFFYQNNSNTAIIDPASSFPSNNFNDPAMQLTGVMQGRTSIAIINGNTYTIGDIVYEGWTLTQIDTDQRIVIVTGPSGRQLTLTAETKSRSGGG